MFGYEGVTLDYVYATGAWNLTLRDLKQLSLNGITYAHLGDEKKKYYRDELFPQKWAEWIKYVNDLEIKDETNEYKTLANG